MDPSQEREPSPDRRHLDLAHATPAEVEAGLLAWEELDEASLDALEAHAEHGATLRRLRRAETWIANAGSWRAEAPPEDACPAAEELFEYGRGPGAPALPAERRAQLDLHLTACGDCRALVETLASPPPLPLFAEPEEREPAAAAPRATGDPASAPSTAAPSPAAPSPAAPSPAAPSPAAPSPAAPSPAAPPARGPRRLARRPVLRTLVPLAAAAGLLLLVQAPWRGPATAAWNGELPGAPLLRGDDSGPLVAPRDRALSLAADGWHGLGAGAAPRFELALPEGTEALRIELSRHAGAALGAADPLTTLRFDPLPPTDAGLAGPALEPGDYTWRAWARVDGLERDLGARDFTVVADRELERALAELAELDEPQRSAAGVWAAHEAGYLGAARALARRLPPGPARDAYLGRAPGR